MQAIEYTPPIRYPDPAKLFERADEQARRVWETGEGPCPDELHMIRDFKRFKQLYRGWYVTIHRA